MSELLSFVAASLGKKVAVLDYVHPSPQGEAVPVVTIVHAVSVFMLRCICLMMCHSLSFWVIWCQAVSYCVILCYVMLC